MTTKGSTIVAVSECIAKLVSTGTFYTKLAVDRQRARVLRVNQGLDDLGSSYGYPTGGF